MKKVLKIGSIVVAIIIALYLLSQAVLFGLFFVGSMQNDIQEEKLAKKGIEYAKIHLEEKYPDLQYTIIDSEPDEYYNGFTHAGWGDIVEVTIEANGEEYKVYANIQEENEGICCDNVQFTEIKQGIINKIKRISGIKSFDGTEYDFELDMSHSWMDYSFYTTYDGDITAFLIREKELLEQYSSFMWNPTIHFGYVDKPENFNITEDDTKFLELFDIVAFVNFKEKIPMQHYSYDSGFSIVQALWSRDVEFNSVWVYDATSKTFEEISHTMTRTEVC